MTPEILKDKICKILDDKKALDINILSVGHMTVVADYFITCTGRSSTQVRTLAEEVIDKLEEEGINFLRNDGIKEGKWAVIDYGSIMVHIFNDENRIFYCLEKLWSDGTNIEVYKPEN
ncbi:MAG: ribosome silencing factor [Clostridia bacterium]|nr:ribosome silencing factor [Clostridia bacterium]